MAKSSQENLAIMFADIVGFTERTSQQSRAENKVMLDSFERIIRPLIDNFSGRLIKMIGDACLATFASPTDAVRCGMAMQDALAERNKDLAPEEQIHIRVAINAGEVRRSNKDVFGEAVNVASRVESMVPPDEIYLTEVVYLAMNKAEVASESVGTHTLKGIPEPIKIYRVPPLRVMRLVAAEEADSSRHGALPYGGMHKLVPMRAAPRWKPGLLIGVTVILTLGGIAAGWALLSPAPAASAPTVAANIVVTPPPPPPPPPTLILDNAESDLRAKRWDEVAQTATKALAENPKDGAAVMLRGHVSAGQGRYSEALASYNRALTLNADLRTNPRFATNLVAALGRAGAAAETIRKYPVELVIEGLLRRATEPGYATRHLTTALITELGHGKEIDRVPGAIYDLAEGETCELRQQGVQALGKARDERALEPLKKLLDSGLMARFHNNCLWSEAKEVVAKLEPRKK